MRKREVIDVRSEVRLVIMQKTKPGFNYMQRVGNRVVSGVVVNEND